VPPGKQTFRPFGAEKLPADKIGQNLAAEELRQSRIVEPGDLMKDARLVHPALGHQEVEVGGEIDPVLSVKLHAAPGVIDPESQVREKAEAAKKGI
jgi:hypothetical protein